MYKVYSPADVDIAIGGVNIDGWDSISISKAVENTSKNIGADGPVGLTWTADETGMFELEVMQQNSPVNRFCAYWQKAQQDQRAPYYADIAVTDKSGGVLTYMKNCFLDNPADQSLAAEAGSRTWTFFVTKLDYAPDVTGKAGVEAAQAIAAMNTILGSSANLGN